MVDFGKWLVVSGALIVAVGLAVWFAPSVPWLGRLPGDVTMEHGGSRIFLPITSCILLSVAISLILNIVARLR